MIPCPNSELDPCAGFSLTFNSEGGEIIGQSTGYPAGTPLTVLVPGNDFTYRATVQDNGDILFNPSSQISLPYGWQEIQLLTREGVCPNQDSGIWRPVIYPDCQDSCTILGTQSNNGTIVGFVENCETIADPEPRPVRVIINDRPYFGEVAPDGTFIVEGIDMADQDVADGQTLLIEVIDAFNQGGGLGNCSTKATVVFQKATSCTPKCTRWQKINQGETVKLYHDTTGWDSTCVTPPVNDPNNLWLQAIDLWNQCHPCGNLFEFVDTPAEADVYIAYEPESQDVNGYVLSPLLNQGLDCFNEDIYDNLFSPANPMQLRIHCNGNSIERTVTTMAHELGHVLGMPHIFQHRFVHSIMGTNPDRFDTVQLFPIDKQQMAIRYPCDCPLTNLIIDSELAETPVIVDSPHSCPGCRR